MVVTFDEAGEDVCGVFAAGGEGGSYGAADCEGGGASLGCEVCFGELEGALVLVLDIID